MDTSNSGASAPDTGLPAHIKSIDDIPGTTVFTPEQSRRGYHLNMCCASLMREENREAFRQDERAYTERFPLTPAQREAMLARDYNAMLALGGNIYYLGKLGAYDGQSFQQLTARMTGIPEDELRKIMLAGGRSVSAFDNEERGKNHG
ncbi:hypothetical protein GCM10023144_31460 [Pigmentiphaga soli]|uniref:Extradiol ring-cleavage dioxygenase LigAB LigA subunit domain-containing protein n=1 Tax=Pigmentiphaga soli TaxID=1007095 RepID=A0ABP8HAX1_9BURK